MPNESIRFRFETVLVAVLALVAVGCATTSAPRTTTTGVVRSKTVEGPCLVRPDFPGGLSQQYAESTFDAAVFRSCRQYAGLEPVDGSAVMGSFISCYQCEKGPSSTCSSKCLEPGQQPMPSDVWVSHVEEILKHCSSFNDPVLGMQELQGLPPQEGQPQDSWNVLVVEVTGPKDLFRPCTNPDPRTTGPCTEDFLDTYPCYDPDGCPGVDLKAKMEAHRSWMAGQAFGAWQVPGGYPWTRQGYTYNWSPDAPTIVGTSEYVIPGGTVIRVCGRMTASTFCHTNVSVIEALCD